MPDRRKLFAPTPTPLEAPSHVRKAASNLKLTGSDYETVRKAIDELGVKYHSPGVVGEAAVHFTLPKFKLAIVFESNSVINERKRREASRSGWTLVILKSRDLGQFTQAFITAQLKDFINEHKPSRTSKPV